MGQYLVPLFWQCGESEERIRNEITQMFNKGIGGFVVESRPHPDFLGESWWRNTGVILDQARTLGMGVWFFDDKIYPSGYANGAAEKTRPDLLKYYLDERHIDAWGPLAGSSFKIAPWLRDGERLFHVVGAKIAGGIDTIVDDSLVVLDEYVRQGVLYWDVPTQGKWRVFILVITRNGGEEWTANYINPVDSQAVDLFIRQCYEPYYERYKDDFGKTFRGFFIDEPRFGNVSGYDARMGNPVHDENYHAAPYFKMPLPWSAELEGALFASLDGAGVKLLPLLFYASTGRSVELQYRYMDTASRLFGELFIGRIGAWCRERGVELIGHTVEDNNAHARLGYGPGHYYRSIRGMSTSGMDIVYQVWPGVTDGRMPSPFGYLDLNFFYWGLTKMAASEAQLDPKKRGRTICEIFGAYGWQEGLKLMKWLTDHVAVRGVNVLVPHAFSPKDFPDGDCPPHFYAQGMNPQWKYFQYWSAYANRVCALLSDGVNITKICVLYHAELEWLGNYMPFNLVVQALQTHLIDCRVIAADHLAEAWTEHGRFIINGQDYGVLVVPWSERIPANLLLRLQYLAINGVEIIFIKSFPREDEYHDPLDNTTTRYFKVLALDQVAEYLAMSEFTDIKASRAGPDLRYYHYKKDTGELYFFVNENIRDTAVTNISVNSRKTPCWYDAYDDAYYAAEYRRQGDKVTVKLELPPYSSIVMLLSDEPPRAAGPKTPASYPHCLDIGGPYEFSLKAYNEETFSPPEAKIALVNIAAFDNKPDFSGTMRYSFSVDPGEPVNAFMLDLGRVYETAEVFINGVSAGVRISPPYRFAGSGLFHRGINTITIEVVNTLVKALGDNVFDRGTAQEPSGLLGPVSLYYA
ncbi:MAG: hypothetical protein LBF63_01255 [Treponema sp.]|jgi:hypothetical protein|nr:hypothetical protein [Treponema sp.]